MWCWCRLGRGTACKHTQSEAEEKRPLGERLPQITRGERRASGEGWARWGEQCGAVWLVTEAEGVQHHLWLFFSAVLSLGTSAMEVNGVLYVLCECLQNRECVEWGKKGISGSCKHFQSTILLAAPACIDLPSVRR